jgi:hypothetical protein
MPHQSAVEFRVAKPAEVGTTSYVFEERTYENRIYIKLLKTEP